MEDNTRVFETLYDGAQQQEEMNFAPPGEAYGEEFEQPYEEEYDEYTPLEEDEIPENFEVYDEELEAQDSAQRFQVAMNVMDLASVLAGVVVIFALTALIINLLSWLRSDISHMFAMFQSTIQ